MSPRLPLLLTLVRAATAPLMVVLALWRPWPAAFGVCLVIALVTDIFDGILARRLGVATANLRRLDSIVDTLFYGCATFALWHLYPQVLRSRWVPLAILLGLELLRYGFDLLKFGREASYHMWSSKAWGLALFIAFFSALALGLDNALIDFAIWLGILADLEGLAISLVLKHWRRDVPSIVHALRLRAAGDSGG
ncbi:MAG: CDP-alcohol phosphatidyltransferase family protein [Proteobacteria bacterium]|nr:CDP-alcohol phosphatidyltransferase family protein [Pseudomonadota bacterium]